MTITAIIACYLMALVGTLSSAAFTLEYAESPRPSMVSAIASVLFFIVSAALATVVPVWIGGGL